MFWETLKIRNGPMAEQGPLLIMEAFYRPPMRLRTSSQGSAWMCLAIPAKETLELTPAKTKLINSSISGPEGLLSILAPSSIKHQGCVSTCQAPVGVEMLMHIPATATQIRLGPSTRMESLLML